MIARTVLPLLVAASTALGPTGAVNEVRIAPDGDDTEITVRLEGQVAVSDFFLEGPPRLILDVEGATSALARRSYEGIGRGGVVRMRSSQFRDEVVRLVFDLTARPDYRLEREDGRVRVRFENPGETFAAWSTAGGGASADGGPSSGGGPSAENAFGTEASASGPPASGGAAGASGGSGDLPAVQEQPRISVAYDSATMLDVLQGFSEFAGVSIVPSAEAAGETVRGVDIRNQPWDVALSAILSAQGLGWQTTESGIIIVDDMAQLRARDTLTTETRVMRINYASADSVASTLRQLATPNRGQVVAYQGTNSVIVTDAPSVVSRMDSLVTALDRRIPQVSIEAKIVFVDRSDVNELGIVYDLKEREDGFPEQSLASDIPVLDPNQPPRLVDLDGDGTPDEAFFETTNETIVNLGGDAIAGLANANDRVSSPALQILGQAVFGEFSLFAFLEALEQHSLSDVQASPNIQVVDNHQARIQVGERTPIRVLERGAQAEEATVNVRFEDTGIILEVTPHITNNNQILLDLSAERSGLQVGLSDVGFVFEKQIGQTRLLLNDGETAVIGGLTLSEVTRSESGIPGLMNLPLVGRLFKTTRENETKQDLIILVTPHIVAPRGGTAPEGG